MKKLIEYLESRSFETKQWVKIIAFIAFILLIVAVSISCASPYMVVQYVDEDTVYCRDYKGFEKHAEIEKGVPAQKGDTLEHIGGYRYYNINAE